jgi:hypothetical protein
MGHYGRVITMFLNNNNVITILDEQRYYNRNRHNVCQRMLSLLGRPAFSCGELILTEMCTVQCFSYNPFNTLNFYQNYVVAATDNSSVTDATLIYELRVPRLKYTGGRRPFTDI